MPHVVRILNDGWHHLKPVEGIAPRHAVSRDVVTTSGLQTTAMALVMCTTCGVAGERQVIPRGVRSVGPDESHAPDIVPGHISALASAVRCTQPRR